MLTAFSTALSALNADSTAINVVGNNLANLNTSGFKDVDVSFHDLVYQTLGVGPGDTQVGLGVGTPVTLQQFTQGAIQNTGNPLDAAIQGDGFFIVSSPSAGIEYTRAGNFQVDANGNLVTPTGEQVLGWSGLNGAVNTNSPVGPINVPVGTLQAPKATTSMSVDLNLSSSAAPGDTYTTSVEVYDSLGTSHVVTLTFTKSSTAGQWNYSVAFPNSDLTSPGTPLTGTLTFNGSGILTSPASNPGPLAVTGLIDGAANMNITWNIFNGTTPRITQFAQPSATSAVSQDGSPTANLVNVSIGNSGQLLAQFSNGSQQVVGQLALATIRNPQSLMAVGNNNFQVSAQTATPAVGLPGTGGRGSVLGGSVEASNVDIAKEFTKLIVFQRGYEANSRVFTTADQLSQDTIALIRQ